MRPNDPNTNRSPVRTTARSRAWQATLAALCLVASAGAAAQPTAGTETWPIAGRQGLVQLVIVPVALARDRDAYQRQIQQLCEPERTCFVNFYTNSSGAPVAMPLPDAIDHEPTATFRRSMKRGADQFTWSCRLQVPNEACF